MNALLSLAIECWRFTKVYERLLAQLDLGEQQRYVSQYRYFLKQMDTILAREGFRLVNLEGHPFDPGIAATALNLGDFSLEDELAVDQMLEPVIMGGEGIVKMGTVLLRKVER
jgi:hypothetical protein